MTDKHSQPAASPDAHAVARGHSSETANIYRITLIGMGLIVMLVVAQLLLTGIYFVLRHEGKTREAEPGPFVQERMGEVVPAPRLEKDPAESLRHVREAEAAALEGPAAVDPHTGRGHVPIERAMELVVEGRRAGVDAKPQAAEGGGR